MVVIAIDRIMKHKDGVPKPRDVKPVIFDKIPDFIGLPFLMLDTLHNATHPSRISLRRVAKTPYALISWRVKL